MKRSFRVLSQTLIRTPLTHNGAPVFIVDPDANRLREIFEKVNRLPPAPIFNDKFLDPFGALSKQEDAHEHD